MPAMRDDADTQPPPAEPAYPPAPDAAGPDGYTTPAEREAAASVAHVPRWAIHRRVYNWTLGLAETRHATWSLFAISFMESSFFPIPPDVLLAPLCLGNRRRAMWFATVTTVASVLGALLGYVIGAVALDTAVALIPSISAEAVAGLQGEFEARGQWYVFVAALTPIPFKLLTITAGAAKMSLPVFLAACVVGRAARFYAVAGLFWWVGPKATPLIDKYFNWLCLAFVVLLVGGFAVLKMLH
jgi:membrane protein YqaA with SNARE-associated domain